MLASLLFVLAQVGTPDGVLVPPKVVDPLNVSIIAGAALSAASGTPGSNATTPFIDVLADFPAIVGSGPTLRAPLRIQLEGYFSGSPGQTVAVEDIKTFKAVSFDAGVHRVFGDTADGRATVSLSGGVTSRLDNQAQTKNPGHGEACVGFWRKDHTASFNFCPIGFSNEVGDPATVGRADGRVTIKNALRLQLSVIVPYANAPSNWYVANTSHNITASVSIGADLDHIFASSPANP